MSKLNIGIDIDGTMTSPYHFIPYLNEMFNKNIKAEDCITYNWESLFDVKEDDLLDRFHNDYMHSYLEAKCVEGAKEVVEELFNDHNVYFVTARSEVLTEITNLWLKQNKLSHIDVHLLGSHYKVDKAAELKCNIFIEDNPSNAIQLANAGIKVFLINTHYNQEVNHPNVVRVDNWNQIKSMINNLR